MKTINRELVNPLVAYRDKTGMSWREIAKAAGLQLSQVYRLATKEQQTEVLRVQLKNIFIIEYELGIDFMSYARAVFGMVHGGTTTVKLPTAKKSK